MKNKLKNLFLNLSILGLVFAYQGNGSAPKTMKSAGTWRVVSLPGIDVTLTQTGLYKRIKCVQRG